MKKMSQILNPPKYETIPHTQRHDLMCIKILEGKYAGIIFHYNTIKILNENDNGEIPFQYDYTIVDGRMQKDLIKEAKLDEFEEVTGAILMDLIANDKRD